MRIFFALACSVFILLQSCHDTNEVKVTKFGLTLRQEDNIKEIDLLFVSGNDTVASHYSDNTSQDISCDLQSLGGKIWEVTILAYGEPNECNQEVYKKVYKYEGVVSYESSTEVVVSYLDEGWKEGFYASYGAGESLVEIFQFPSPDQYDLEIFFAEGNLIDYAYIDFYSYYDTPNTQLNPCDLDFEELWNVPGSPIMISIPITKACGTEFEISTFDSQVVLNTGLNGEIDRYLKWGSSLNAICN